MFYFIALLWPTSAKGGEDYCVQSSAAGWKTCMCFHSAWFQISSACMLAHMDFFHHWEGNAYVAGSNWCVAVCYTEAFRNKALLKAEIHPLMKWCAALRADPQLLQNFECELKLFVFCSTVMTVQLRSHRVPGLACYRRWGPGQHRQKFIKLSRPLPHADA